MAYNAAPDAKTPPPNYPPQMQSAYPSNQAAYNAGGPGAQYQNSQYAAGGQPPQQSGSPYSQAPPQQASPYAQPPQQGSLYGHPQQSAGQYPQQPQVQQWGQPAVVQVTPQPQIVVAGQPQVMVMGQCAQGQHYYQTHFGACGIIAAILLFPIGLIFLFVDQQRRCTRCGASG